ncbi:hypothetical protein SDC9_72998 [bioreactor metagenome]|uniref:Uncharacterized protein n=1 Tax=bioreactor metagenome TaxID=1076179 RepID=A0A644YD77_9ZZZZ
MDRVRSNNLKLALEKMDELTTVLEKLKEILQTVLDEEEEALGNLPESFQEGERGQQMQEYISIMEEVIDSLGEMNTEDIYQKIEEITEG